MWCPYCGHDLRDDLPGNPKPESAIRFKCSECGATCFMLWSKTGKVATTETFSVYRRKRPGPTR